MSTHTANSMKALPGKSKTIALWIVTGLVGALFVLVGLAKFGNPEMAEHFRQWGYADWFRDLIGAIEVSAGVALLFRRSAFYAAGALGIVMVGAIYTHVAHGEVPEAAAPLVLLVVLAAIGYARRPGSAASHI